MTNSKEANTPSPLTEGEIDVFEIAIVLAKRKRLLIGLPFVVAIVAALIVLQMPNIYTASVKILPPQQGTSAASALLNQLGGALSGLAGLAGVKNSSSDIYVGMLKSRTLADNLIARFDLSTRYGQELMSGTRRALEGRTVISVGKTDGMILIEVDDKDPKFAAELANAYVEELRKVTAGLAVTEASKRRLFFEQQLEQAGANLSAAQIAARQGLERGGLASIDEQGRSMAELTGRIRAQISVKEVQIGAMRTFASEGNPELQRAQNEMQVLKRELARMEGAQQSQTGGGSKSGSPSGLDTLARVRDVKYYETIYGLLAQQFELAKLDEAKDSTIIQIMDKAIEPDQKTKPKRTQAVLLSAFGALCLAALWVLVSEFMARAMADQQRASQFERLRNHLSKR